MEVRKKFITKFKVTILKLMVRAIFTKDTCPDEVTMQLIRTNPRGLTFQLRCCIDSTTPNKTTITLCKGHAGLNTGTVTTNKKIEVDLPIHTVVEKWHYWRQGQTIQTVFSELTTAQREFLISGLDEDDWQKIFGPDTTARTTSNT